jgi:isoquinoline 1-oxidoreductase alpha subunit
MITLNVNGRSHQADVSPETPLLWALRDDLKLTGTKFGCGEALCGACTVHIDGEATRSCSVAVGDIGEKTITTIEGLSGAIAKAVKDAWITAAAPQCGYCQPGFIMAITSILSTNRYQTKDAVLSQLTNICRCGTYDAIRDAVVRALSALASAGGETQK